MRRTLRTRNPQRLSTLVDHAEYATGDDVLCSGCSADPRHIEPGDLFIATCDSDRDTHEEAEIAVARGAVAVVAERLLPVSVPQIVVNDGRIAFGQACHRLAGDPSKKLPVIGITGTLGKTTSTLLTAAVLNAARRGVAVCSTLAHCDSRRSIPARQTTPRADVLAGLLRSAAERECSHAVVEISSAALAEQRVAGLQLQMGVITNLKKHHIDRHNSFAAYRSLKERMLSLMSPAAPLVLNLDDPFCRQLLVRLDRPVLTVGMQSEADVTATLIERMASEQTFLLEAGSDSILVRSRMIGDHHIRNCLSAAAVGLLAGFELPDIAAALESVDMIPGHMERVECGQDFTVFIDEARSHDALAASLKAARSVAGGRVICLVSPGEELDANDNPLLGKVLEKGAHVRIVTGGACEFEHPLARSHDVLDGFEHPGRAHVIPSRGKAIRWAMGEAQSGDVVLITGAGHRGWLNENETTDDVAVARECLYEQAARELRSRPLVVAYHG